MEKFIDLIISQFEEPITLTNKSVLGELDVWDSLTSFMIIDVLKEKYNKEFSEEELKQLTLEELFSTI